MFDNVKVLTEKWKPVLEAESAPEVTDNWKKGVTAICLENTEKALNEQRAHSQYLTEAPTNASSTGAGGAIDNWDPILISLVRRTMPNLIAYNIAGVQPMNGPTGMIFAMRSRYVDALTREASTEALVNEADTSWSSSSVSNNISSPPKVQNSEGGTHGGDPSGVAGDGFEGDPFFNADWSFGNGMTTAQGEELGEDRNTDFNEMSFTIERATVTARTRALKAEYTMELAQDLKAIHGLDAEAELANILSGEVLAEINRELIRTINSRARLGCMQADITADGIFDLDVDADGRWSVEKYKGLLVQLQREANVIARETRRGKGNIVICSSDVAAILSASGMLDHSPVIARNGKMVADDTGNTLVGTLNSGIKVFIDPYANVDYLTIGYKGSNFTDAGMFYCPYVPLTMVRAVGEQTFQPKIGFKTRYGMVANPFAGTASANDIGAVRSNTYYRIFRVDGILGTPAPAPAAPPA